MPEADPAAPADAAAPAHPPPANADRPSRPHRSGGRGFILAAYWLLLFAATHYPRVELRGLPQQSDKGVHFLAYALLAWLFWRWWTGRGRPNAAALTLVVLATYAAVDEWTQSFVGRGTDPADWAADVAGAGVAVGLLEWRRWRVRRADRMRSGASGPGGRVGANRN